MRKPVFPGALLFGLATLALLLAGCASSPPPSKSDAIAVWQHKGATWDIYYSIWDQDAKQWHAPGGLSAPIAVDAGDDNDPAISSNDTTAMAVWSKDSNGSSIYYSVWDGSRWTAPAIVSAGQSDTDPAIAMDPSGNALSVWVRGGDSLYYSYYRRGAGWSLPAGLDTSGMARVTLPELAYSVPEGRYYLVFTGNNGTANFAYAAGYGPEGWSIPLAISDKDGAVLDFDVPATHRTGIAAAEGKAEVTAVWPGPYNQLYSAKLGGQARAYSFGEMPDVAYDSNDTASGALSKDDDLWQEPDVNAPSGENLISSLRLTDQRPSIAFIRDRAIGLAVWWNAVAPPGQIYYSYQNYSYGSGSAWIGATSIDPSLDGTANRNPALTALGHAPSHPPPSCGDGNLQPPEQCELGIPCQNGSYCGNDCMCHPARYSQCGNGVLDWPWERCEVGSPCANQSQYCAMPPCFCEDKPVQRLSCARNSLSVAAANQSLYQPSLMLCQDDCKDLNPALSCDPATCTCVGNVTSPTSCAADTLDRKGVAAGGACKDDCVAFGNTDLVCDPVACVCKERGS